MKKLIIFLIAALSVISFSACANSEKASDSSSLATTAPTSTASEEETTVSEQPTLESVNSSVENEESSQKITLSVNGETAVVNLLENDAVEDFKSMLPLTLTFEDYNNTEKIATLPRELNIKTAPTSCDPDVGTFAYYAPWGNLSVFYEDFRESNNLIPLGTFESGIELFADIDGSFTVTIELEE